MAEVFVELEQVLRSKKVTMTLEEANLLSGCKSKALNSFAYGFAFTTAIASAGRLNPLLRVCLSGGSAFACGVWRLSKSLDSCADHILALHGSRMQEELANIIVRKYHHDPGKIRLLARHFYSEQVFDDSNSDQPRLRWRYRNSFGDAAAYGQLTNETDIHSGRNPQLDDYDLNRNMGNNSYGNPQNDSKTISVDFPSNSDIERADSELKWNSVSKATSLFSRASYGVDVIGDPLDCIFGGMMTKEEICHPVNKVPPQSHRRSRRKRRTRQLEVSLNT
ncbi:uncharacterized protein LOC115750289 isoform X2 [Rhodamnia argentea]|uniref:Uncharacterized protein LOC115750289 isoform X2 n=1 Tax=Rhodamnia argentea TaxID=178133 RepID=A0ABM3HFM7_9MYRT|nr:uncharacterized protein LOC115750289 isoform X2 [Rhodamnia argentea]